MKELFYQDLHELISFALKLFLHCVVLVIVLTFVFVVGWIDRYFQRAYSNMRSTSRDTEHLNPNQARQPERRIRRITTQDKRESKPKLTRRTRRLSK